MAKIEYGVKPDIFKITERIVLDYFVYLWTCELR